MQNNELSRQKMKNKGENSGYIIHGNWQVTATALTVSKMNI